jgi:nitroreductase
MTSLTTDEVLTTTRAVRRRVDTSRPVDIERVLECLRIGVQAPAGSDFVRVRWMVLTDPTTRDAIASLYQEAVDLAMAESRDHSPNDRIREDAREFARILPDIPVLVIAYAVGSVPDDPVGVPGFFGSVIPAIWNFQLALRSRGLGSVYTTALNRKEREVSQLLDVPEGVTQVAMIPVSHTIGTQFKPAPRPPITEVTFFNRWNGA